MTDNSLPEDTGQSDSGQKLYIPIDAAAGAPVVGDPVECTVKGTVESLHGDTACVVPSEINGQPAPDMPSDSSEHDRLYKQAEAMDAQDMQR